MYDCPGDMICPTDNDISSAATHASRAPPLSCDPARMRDCQIDHGFGRVSEPADWSIAPFSSGGSALCLRETFGCTLACFNQGFCNVSFRDDLYEDLPSEVST